MPINPKLLDTLIPPDEIADRIHEVCPPDKLKTILSQMYTDCLECSTKLVGQNKDNEIVITQAGKSA